jgi:hypothetical protein
MLAEAQAVLEKSQATQAAAADSVLLARKYRETYRSPPPAGAAAAIPSPLVKELGLAVAQAEQRFASLVHQAELAATAAERQAAVARANKLSLEARIAAEQAKFATPADPNLAALALAAGKAERQAAFHQAEAAAALAEQQLWATQQALKADDAKTKAAAADAEKKLADAKTALATAQAALASDSPAYASLGPVYPAASTGRRLAFARWVASREHPRTARVAINHIWLRHFGQALVPTIFDFGINGAPPTHPELLDWLAVELMENGWKMQPIHKLIVTSNTYRMASTSDPANQALDPDNKFLWKSPARRMEAEVVRDSIFHVAGQLDLRRGGPELDQNTWFSNHRRSIYFRHAQEKQMLFMKLFDGAAVTECYSRKESIVPQQALALANSELTLVQSRLVARGLAGSTAHDPAEFVRRACEQVLSRPATAEEITTCVEFLTQQEQLFQAKREQLGNGAEGADATKPAADPALRARENLVHVLLNHHDFVTIR